MRRCRGVIQALTRSFRLGLLKLQSLRQLRIFWIFRIEGYMDIKSGMLQHNAAQLSVTVSMRPWLHTDQILE